VTLAHRIDGDGPPLLLNGGLMSMAAGSHTPARCRRDTASSAAIFAVSC
jgi:hypothetical protein